MTTENSKDSAYEDEDNMTDTSSFDELCGHVMGDPDARAAARENSLRREIAKVVEESRLAKGWDIQRLAKEAGVPVSQIMRVTHRELGGVLELGTIQRVADALDLTINISLASS